MTPEVVLVASAGDTIGLGHVYRCRALAQALPDARLVLGPPKRWMEDITQGAVVVLDTLHGGNVAVTMSYVTALHERGARVAVIDSMPPDHYPETALGAGIPDLLITPYVAADRLRPEPPGGVWLKGGAYAILPAAFTEARGRIAAGSPDRVLVLCGGADPSALSPRIARALVSGHHPIDLVVGPQFATALVDELSGLARAHECLVLHRAPETILPLYLSARLVVGRPGLVRYEAAALGRPAVYLWEGGAYLDYFRAFRSAGIAEIHLAAESGGEAAFFDRLAQIAAANPAALPAVPHMPALSAIDLRGAARVVTALADLAAAARKRA